MNVGKTKSPPDEYVKHVQAEFNRIVRRDFTDAEGKRWAERRIAKALNLSQPQVHVMLQDECKGFGVNALIALASYENTTVDALLGRSLPLPTEQRGRQLDEIIERVDELKTLLQERGFAWSPSSKAGKIWAELERAKIRAIAEKHHDAKIRRANDPVRRRAAG